MNKLKQMHKLILLIIINLMIISSSYGEDTIEENLIRFRQQQYQDALNKINKQESSNLNDSPSLKDSSIIPSPTESYDNMQIITQPDVFVLYWRANQTDIVFEAHVKMVDRWFGFGFPKDNLYTMNSADVVIAWVNDNGTAHFSERHTIFVRPYSATLYLDSVQNWMPLYMARTGSHTIIKFTRKLIICETIGNDINVNISSHSTSVIFASGSLLNGDVSYHGESRGGVFIDFLKNVDLTKLDNCVRNNTPSFKSTPTEYFTDYAELIPNKYVIYWNTTNTTFTAEVHVKTNGWVGFGFSPNGNMDKSDVFIGWVSNGIANFTDRFIYDKRVLIDTNNNLKLLSYSETGEYTIFKYSRPILLCDPDDRTIEPGTPFVIFAYGDSDPPQGSDISYHGFLNRGTKQLVLIGSTADKLKKSQDIWAKNNENNKYEVFDFSISNAVFPNSTTYYYCKAFQIPTNLIQKRHVLKWELLMPSVNAENIHHIVYMECSKEYNGYPEIKDGDCFSQPHFFKYCKTFSYVWAVGGPLTFNFPPDTGYPMGGDTDYTYLVAEVHYNNPTGKIGYINSLTLRLFATRELQKHELGVLTVGGFPDPISLNIPPKVSNLVIDTYCYNECIRPNLLNNNLTFILAAPHTHLLGMEIYTSIIRNGVDIGYLYKNSYYNFDFQNGYILDPPVQVTKDDALITKCVYSSNRESITQGGPTTQDEMCLHFLTYYPRSSTFKECYSGPNLIEQYQLFSQLKSNGLLNFTDSGIQGGEQLTSTLYSAYRSLAALTKFPESITQGLTNLYANSGGYTNCLPEKSLMLPKITPSNKYIPPDQCKV